ncbi:hypothetical protein DENIS_4279 [Desulfonema ishimotonii]|uniref:DUF4340 domain-containing protein n=1 Tax=Desulfonema ishimotonii TaxID=45657 RepID=A0A401G254_9BACT|nr:DUF4340 domain-containing protein [Desulfonema ishimotonii]GBC63285.1 hypothetical protein DENIS_4279 [Desulfonema ishimotonii]
MKSKTFIILAAVCGVLAVVSYFIIGQPAHKSSAPEPAANGKLLSDLPVDALAGLTISGPEGEVVLKKGESVWDVQSRSGYPANFEKIADLVDNLKEMKAGRSFEATDETVARLNLADPAQKDAPKESLGTRITLRDKGEKALGDIIIGKAREAAAGSGGHYVKPVSEQTIYLVDKDFRYIDQKPEMWLKKDFLDIQAGDVEKIICFDAKTKTPIYTVRRPEKGKMPAFVDPPAGKKVILSKVTNMFGALLGLKLEDVSKPGEVPPEKAALDISPYYEFHLYNGMIYAVCPGNALKEKPNYHYFGVRVGYADRPEPAAEETEPAKNDGAAAPDQKADVKDDQKADAPKADARIADGDQKDETAPAANPEKTPEQVKAEAEALNQTFSSWIYVVPKWKVGHLLRNPEDFFEKPEAEKADQSKP